MKHLHRTKLIAAMAALPAFSAYALEPAHIDAGVFKVTPTLSLSTGYDDNVFANDTEQDSLVSVVKGRLTGVADSGAGEYRLGAGIEHGNYDRTSGGNYVDGDVNAAASWELDRRNQLGLRAKYLKDHLDRTDDEATDAPEEDRFHTVSYGINYRFGSEEARGRLVLDLNRDDKTFDNNRAANAVKDMEATKATATFLYRVAPRTSLLAEYSNIDNDYDALNAGENRDNEVKSAYVGATWKATGKTTGSARFGYQEKEFDNSSLDSEDDTSWEIKVDWEPVDYTKFTLKTMQTFDETTSSSNVNKQVTRHTLAWQHEWNDRLTSTASYTFSESDDEGSIAAAQINREKDLIELGVIYELQRWVDLGLKYRYTDQDGTTGIGAVSSRDTYERNEIVLSLDMAL